jgi:hypothetical protein
MMRANHMPMCAHIHRREALVDADRINEVFCRLQLQY